MKHFILFCGLIGCLFLSGCKDAGEVLTEEQPRDNSTMEDSYADVFYGSTSLKIQFSLTQQGSFYYIVTEDPFENIESSVLKESAMGDGSEDIMAKGIVEVSNAQIGDTLEVIINALSPGKHVYTYTLAEYPTNTTDNEEPGLLLETFSNQLRERQVQNDFYSTALGKNMGYLSYALEDYFLNPDKDYPLLIFLHGMGEYAKEGEFNLYRNTTIPELIEKGNDYPFVVISPQLVSGGWSAEYLDELLDHVIENYNIDESRVYMTGISLGGIGTWNYATTYPQRLTAVVPISGSGNTASAGNMQNVPVWAFHNSSDGFVATSGSVNMINELKECTPGCPTAPKITIYPDAGHNAWVRTYDGSAGHDIFEWLLSFKK